MHLKIAYVPLVEWTQFENSGPTIREVRMNKVKVNKAKNLAHFCVNDVIMT